MHKSLVSLAPVAILASMIASITLATAQLVDLGYASYTGVVNPTTHNVHFLGIRYAAPPTGIHRWQAPIPPANIPGVHPADKVAPSCVSGAEDCLFLNVYTPDVTKKLPVIVWIHGGGYVSGSASSFNGEDLILESNKGVVTVLIEYRLGVFGFLPGKAVKENGALNAGLLDQEFALKWVQQHISKFGGDPTQVNIWGASAGAGSVIQHVIAHDGKTAPPLFRGAMTSSTFLPSQYAFNDPIAEHIYSQVVAYTGCTSSADTLKCLRGVGVAALETANTKVRASGFYGTFVFAPVVDGDFITQRPTEALRQGKINGEGVLAITSPFEGTGFVDSKTAAKMKVPDYIKKLFPRLGPADIAVATAEYSKVGDHLAQIIAIMGEAIFICPTYYVLSAFNMRSYKGEFAVPPGLHVGDQAYYFLSLNAHNAPPYNNPAFIKGFQRPLFNFATGLDPNVNQDMSHITPRWNAWRPEASHEMLYNRTGAAPVIRSITTSIQLSHRCRFWESVGALTGQ